MANTENFKIHVPTPEISKQVQEALFELGCEWFSKPNEVRYLDLRYLFVEGSQISYTHSSNYFATHPYPEKSYIEFLKEEIDWSKPYEVKVDSRTHSEQIQNLLRIAGCGWVNKVPIPSDTDKPYLRVRNETIYWDTTRSIGVQSVTYEDLLAKYGKNDYSNCKIHTPNRIINNQVQQALFKLGYKRRTSNQPSPIALDSRYLYTSENQLSYGNGIHNFKESSKREVAYQEILGESTDPEPTQQTISQLYIQTTNGNAINLRPTQGTITRGSRPTGIPVSGRTSRVTTTLGHLSNKAIYS